MVIACSKPATAPPPLVCPETTPIPFPPFYFWVHGISRDWRVDVKMTSFMMKTNQSRGQDEPEKRDLKSTFIGSPHI